MIVTEPRLKSQWQSWWVSYSIGSSDFALDAISSPIWISELLLGVCLDPSLRRSHRGIFLSYVSYSHNL